MKIRFMSISLPTVGIQSHNRAQIGAAAVFATMSIGYSSKVISDQLGTDPTLSFRSVSLTNLKPSSHSSEILSVKIQSDGTIDYSFCREKVSKDGKVYLSPVHSWHPENNKTQLRLSASIKDNIFKIPQGGALPIRHNKTGESIFRKKDGEIYKILINGDTDITRHFNGLAQTKSNWLIPTYMDDKFIAGGARTASRNCIPFLYDRQKDKVTLFPSNFDYQTSVSIVDIIGDKMCGTIVCLDPREVLSQRRIPVLWEISEKPSSTLLFDEYFYIDQVYGFLNEQQIVVSGGNTKTGAGPDKEVRDILHIDDGNNIGVVSFKK